MAAMTAAAAVAGGRQRIAHMKETALNHLQTNIDEASVYIQTGEIDDPRVYCKTCMKLGSAIDSAIAMNAFPSSSHLPRLVLVVREVYWRKTQLMQPSLMLLMLPIKAACQIGWFPDFHRDDLLMIAKEVSYGFSDTDKMNIQPSDAHSSVSNIVSRFYPTMKVEHILTSFDVKAGYGIFVADFHISLGNTPRHCRKLWLLVAQLDNMDTAACITSPLNVDFLINGSEVPNRTKSDMGEGPQLPSNITKMIKYGLNILQVFGDFDGHYFIAIAFMNSISPPDPPQLQDYLRPMSDGANSDCDSCEMSSRISLYCPISKHRIKTPVKGYLCNHPQCFDYNYFIEVNSTKPTWKCPLCDNPVCNRDIRIDQEFLKILNEVAKDVDDVIISEDGSWMVAETNWDPLIKQAQSQTVFTEPPGQSQVNVCSIKQAQSQTVFTEPVVYPGQSQVNICTTTQAKNTTMVTPLEPSSPHSLALAFSELRKGGEQGNYTSPGESHPAPNISQASPTQLQEGSCDAMPSGRMRGSLRGDQLQAARLKYLAPPQQPARANEPWSRPPIPSLPLPFLMPQNSTNPGNVRNSGNLSN
ncbi:hypothetical protein SSX86_027240 [Deinandra increscens subsp. villosa]|uniref:SP-RING-type domain-containing protein n=1 Tax=Deinandra increscens subsp. villosa TaxID=3103831 RepID=A0AAP0CHJ0_9ASTR